MDRHCRYLRMIVEEMFEVWFEDCILKEPVLLEAEYLAGLNKLRKYSLFSIHKTGHKQRIPFYSYSVVTAHN